MPQGFSGVRHAFARAKAARRLREKTAVPERDAYSGIRLSRWEEEMLRDGNLSALRARSA